MSNQYFVNLWTTYKCNFSCRYCYEHHLHRTVNMDVRTADKTIDFIKSDYRDNSEFIMNFHGGEPLLEFSLIKHIVRRIKNEICPTAKFGITTNGSLITNEVVKFLKENFHYDVSISIDGTQKTHSINRKCVSEDISYNTLIQNALMLNREIPDLRVRMTFDRMTAPYLSKDIIYLFELGFKNIVPVADFCSKEWKAQDFEIVREQFSIVKQYLSIKNAQNLIYAFSDEFQMLPPCTAGHNYYSIAPNGDIYPCTLLVGDVRFIIGNVIDGIDYVKLSAIDEINKSHNDVCSDCALRNYCSSSRCKLINIFITGDYSSPNLVECNMMNIKYQLATDR